MEVVIIMSSVTKNLLSENEQAVFDYIKKETDAGKKLLKEPMKAIGRKIGSSEATVHRAVTKLLSRGVIGIISSSDKSESNAIQYFGDYDTIGVLKEEPFFDMIMELKQRADRFKSIVETYATQYEATSRVNEELMKEVEDLKKELKTYRSADSGEAANGNSSGSFISYEGRTLISSDIVGVTDIDDDYIAFIVKR